jgi:hypothetical protein
MPAVLERIRLEVGGNSPKVLHSAEWSCSDAAFLSIAREALVSYYKPGGSLSVRDDLDTPPDVPARNAEAIRLVRDGREIARYDLHDLLRERNAHRS